MCDMSDPYIPDSIEDECDGSVVYGPGFTTKWESMGRTCFAVSYSNYEPSEIESLWSTYEKAKTRAEQLGDMWEVVEWKIQ